MDKAVILSRSIRDLEQFLCRRHESLSHMAEVRGQGRGPWQAEEALCSTCAIDLKASETWRQLRGTARIIRCVVRLALATSPKSPVSCTAKSAQRETSYDCKLQPPTAYPRGAVLLLQTKAGTEAGRGNGVAPAAPVPDTAFLQYLVLSLDLLLLAACGLRQSLDDGGIPNAQLHALVRGGHAPPPGIPAAEHPQASWPWHAQSVAQHCCYGQPA